MPTQTGSLDLSSQKKAHDDAAKVATNYISVDSTGLMVADGDGTETPSTATTRNVFIDADSVDIRDGQESRASFGEVVRLGKEYVSGGSNNENRIELDYRSFSLFDKEGDAYLRVMDMRDRNGVIEQTFKANGVTKVYEVAVQVQSVSSVSVDGVETTDYTRSGQRITLGSMPAQNANVVIRYTPDSSAGQRAKYFTFGTRGEGISSGLRNIGALSSAFGREVVASGPYSFASGYQSNASSAHAHAFGFNAHARGNTSFAANAAYANGGFSFAEGYQSVANGARAHAQNGSTTANGDDQTALGRYNVADTTSAVIIGNGSDGARSNALTVDWEGNVEAAGEVKAGGSTTLVPIGTILDFAAATPPTGYLTCDGSAVSRTDYAALFAVIGTTWGAGDGSTTFNLPDFRGRTSIGAGTGTASDATAHALASSGGAETHILTPSETATKNHSHTYAKSKTATDSHTLTVSEIPAHKHNINERNNSGTSTGWAYMTENGKYAASGTRCVNTGGGGGHTHGIGTASATTTGNPTDANGGAHNNMAPFATVTKIIRAI